MTLDTVMSGLYSSEINCSISCFWDGGWDVKLGDNLNGFVAVTTVDTLGEAAAWLHARALEHFPESEYAKRSAERTT